MKYLDKATNTALQQLALPGVPEPPPVTLTELRVVAMKVTERGRLTATVEGTVVGEGVLSQDLAYLDRAVWVRALMTWAGQIQQGGGNMKVEHGS